jgi:hypothetical protein
LPEGSLRQLRTDAQRRCGRLLRIDHPRSDPAPATAGASSTARDRRHHACRPSRERPAVRFGRCCCCSSRPALLLTRSSDAGLTPGYGTGRSRGGGTAQSCKGGRGDELGAPVGQPASSRFRRRWSGCVSLRGLATCGGVRTAMEVRWACARCNLSGKNHSNAETILVWRESELRLNLFSRARVRV